MTQIVINTANIAPASTQNAFNQTNQNFTAIWAAGPVDSNIRIANNTILSNNLNGNLNLATTGTGVVQIGTNLIPDRANLRMIGSASKPFNTVYTQYVTTQTATVTGNLFVPGNLFVSGATVYVNEEVINLGNSTIVLSANAVSPALADGSGLFVAGSESTFQYSYLQNSWVSNLPVTAPAFIGDGSQLTGVTSSIDGSSITGTVLSANVVTSNLQSVGTLNNLQVAGYVSASGNITGAVVTGTMFVGNAAGLTGIAGAGITGNVGNSDYSTFAGTAGTANLAAVATHALNADTAVLAINSTRANTANTATFAQRANVANHSYMADIANSAIVAGRAESVEVLQSITVTGNVIAGNVAGVLTTATQPNITSVGTLNTLSVSGNTSMGALTAAAVSANTVSAVAVSATGNVFTTGSVYANSYFYANGTPFIGGGGGPGNYSNANVAAYLPTYSGDLGFIVNLTATGNVSLGPLTTGNITGGNVTATSMYADYYYYANGSPVTSSQGVFGSQQFYGYNIAGPYPLQYPTSNNDVIVTVNGLAMAPVTYYNIVGNSILFTDVMATTDLIDVRYLGQGSVLGDQQFRGDNTVGPFTLSQSATANSVVVTINGLTQTPNIAAGGSYSVSNNGVEITFVDTVAPSELVDVRFLATGVAGGINMLANTITFNDGTVQSTAYTVVAVPSTPVGQAGDVQGMVAYDTTYWYWCTADYDGISNIWSSASNGGGGPSNYGNANVAAYLPTYTGNITSSNMSASNTIVATGNITAGNVSVVGQVAATTYYGDGSNLTGIASGAAEAPFTIQASNFTVTAGSRYGVNTTGGVVTATLPSTPTTGSAVFFADAGGAYATNNLIVDPNGQTIMGTSGTMTVSTNNQSVGLFYNGTTWRTYNAG
jgi:hypothetical protein